jgi:hypothetical protein
MGQSAVIVTLYWRHCRALGRVAAVDRSTAKCCTCNVLAFAEYHCRSSASESRSEAPRGLCSDGTLCCKVRICSRSSASRVAAVPAQQRCSRRLARQRIDSWPACASADPKIGSLRSPGLVVSYSDRPAKPLWHVSHEWSCAHSHVWTRRLAALPLPFVRCSRHIRARRIPL